MAARHIALLSTLLLMSGAAEVARAQVKSGSEAQKCDALQPSLGRALCRAGQREVHILYIHGIGAEWPGDSQVFQKSLCKFLKNCKLPKYPVKVRRDVAAGAPFAPDGPPLYRYMGTPVWTKDNWSASTPFVDHYVLHREDGGPVVVDEINWWPLVFPLKCRNIMVGEASLAGPDKELLDLCSGKQDPNHPDVQPYAWIPPDEAKDLESRPTNGARLNRGVKNSLMDWGFSDPMMAVGPMRELFRDALRQLFVKSAEFNADGTSSGNWNPGSVDKDPDRQFIMVSHSLGSFLVLSALRDHVTAQRCDQLRNAPPPTAGNAASSDTEDGAACYLLEHTSMIYFFANQVPLLYLAEVAAPRGAGLAPAEAAADLSGQVNNLQAVRRQVGRAGIHITAFSDPSDLLSWQLPAVDNTVIENCHVRNTFWRWLVASPEGAHIKYAQNDRVLRIMLDPEKYGDGPCKTAK
jgi:hypothetical protein